ncbi:hypothetical protein PANT_22c00169 [Moesziomyces antarcticus T-34]|uniref:Uncharacterized protein n=1 Tax=Pseudozyma antarctica (strain T-34) TaxID=1151754 RepID=M9LSE4_PSEA3|nr:hypothetical protein PANT_22c00169 [Moesziomyces antarcticus T-34]
MAKKSARALAAAEASRTPPPEPPSKVSVNHLSAKSCLTCGRVITPRAKWASDWGSIKYCSDRCRSSRPGKLVARFSQAEKHAALAKYDGCKVKGDEMHVDVELWVESVLLDVAARKKEATLDDVQQQILVLLKEAEVLQESDLEQRKAGSGGQDAEEATGTEDERSHLLLKALDSAPGLRERIRRAARRLALGITHDSDPAQTTITTTQSGRIELLQAGKTLRTVEDLSFAKGTLTVRHKS